MVELNNLLGMMHVDNTHVLCNDSFLPSMLGFYVRISTHECTHRSVGYTDSPAVLNDDFCSPLCTVHLCHERKHPTCPHQPETPIMSGG